jgi:hypothetical protein
MLTDTVISDKKIANSEQRTVAVSSEQQAASSKQRAASNKHTSFIVICPLSLRHIFRVTF